MAEILLKDQFNLLVGDRSKLSGVEVFSLYYEKMLPQILQEINDNGVT